MIYPAAVFQNFTLITLAIVLVVSHMTKVKRSNVNFEKHCNTVGTDTDFSHDVAMEYVQNMDYYRLRLYVWCIDSCTPMTLMYDSNTAAFFFTCYINTLHPLYNHTTQVVLTCFRLTPVRCCEYTVDINIPHNHFHCLGSICIIPFSLPCL